MHRWKLLHPPILSAVRRVLSWHCSAQALKYKGQAPDTPPLPKLKRAPRLQVLVGALQIVDGLGSLAINNVSLDLPATPYALGIAVSDHYPGTHIRGWCVLA